MLCFERARTTFSSLCGANDLERGRSEIIAPDHGSVLMQSLFLGFTQITISVTVNFAIALMAGRVATRSSLVDRFGETSNVGSWEQYWLDWRFD